jgi:rare lipoprotein A (peptidoglycan hydrolase)
MLKLKLLFIFLLVVDIFAYGQYRTVKNVKPGSAGEVVVASGRNDIPDTQQTAKASWYDRQTCSSGSYGTTCKTANGEIFDDAKYTLACDSRFRLGTTLHICYLGKCIDAVCNDQGDFAKYGRLFDLSRHAFSSLADTSHGVIMVSWEIK